MEKNVIFQKKFQNLETFSAVIFFHMVSKIYELYILSRLLKGYNLVHNKPYFKKKYLGFIRHIFQAFE